MPSLRSVLMLVLLVGLLAVGCDQGAEETTVPTTLPASSTTAASIMTTTGESTTAPPIDAPWTLETSPFTLTSLVAVSAEEAWAIGWVRDREDNRSWVIARFVDGAWSWMDLPAFYTDLPVTGLAVAPDGTVWVSGGGGVFAFDGVEWTERYDRPVHDLAAAPDGTVWITAPRRLHRWDGESFVGVETPDRPLSTDLAVAADGRLWVTVVYGWSRSAVLLGFDGASWEEVPIADYPPLREEVVAMEAAPNGDLWIAGSIQTAEPWLPFLARFDGETWATYDPPFPAGDIAVGPARVWFSGSDGLVSFDGTDWTYHIQGQRVLTVDVAPDGTVWYSDEQGVHTLGIADFAVGSMVGMPAPVDYLRVLAVSAGEMLAIMDDGLICRLQSGLRRECYGLAGEGVVQGLALAPDGVVWAATTVGVFSFDGARWVWRFPGSAGGIAVGGDGTVWVAGPWGLARADWDAWGEDAWVVADADPGLRPAEGEPVRLAVAADGTVWMAGHSRGGPLLRYDGTALEEVPIGGGTEDPGWDSLWIREVAAAANGDIWVVGSSSPAPDRGSVVVTRFDGVGWTAYEWPAQAMASVADVAVGPDGVVWFGTYDGLASFDGREWTAHIEGRGAWSVDVAPDGTVWYVDDYGAHTFGTP